MYTNYFVLERYNTGIFRVLAEHSPWPAQDHGLGSPAWTLVKEFPAGEEFKAQADVLAARLNTEERQRVLAEPVTRYLTRNYVALEPDGARRLAGIDHTPLEQIRITPGLRVIYNCSSWILWSDRKITTGIGFPLAEGGNLSPDAITWITTVRGSDGGRVDLPGGLATLADIKTARQSADLAAGPSRGVYAHERIETYDVEWLDGTHGQLYVHTAGYFEGYQYDVYASREAAVAAMGGAPGPEGTYMFPPDRYDYDPELGFVAKGEE